MYSSKFLQRARDVAQHDVVPRHAAGPTTAATMQALAEGASPLEIATFRAGPRVIAIPKDPSALALRHATEVFRREAVRARLDHDISRLESIPRIDREKSEAMVRKFSKAAAKVAESHPAAKKVHAAAEEALAYIASRPPRSVDFQLGNLFRRLFEISAETIREIEHGAGNSAPGDVGTDALEKLKTIVNMKRGISRLFGVRPPDGRPRDPRMFDQIREWLFDNRDAKPAEFDRPLNAALLERRLARLFFAQQGAMVEGVADAVGAYAAAPGKASLQTAVAAIKQSLDAARNRSDMTQNPFCESRCEVRELISDLVRFGSSKTAAANAGSPSVVSVMSSLARLVRHEHFVQSWLTPGALLYGRDQIPKFIEERSSISWYDKRRASTYLFYADALINFRYSGTMFTQEAWKRFWDSERGPTGFLRAASAIPAIGLWIGERPLRALETLRKTSERCVEECRTHSEISFPKSAPIEIQAFSRADGMAPSAKLIEEIADLERENLLADPAPGLGLRSIMTAEELTERAMRHDATFLALRKGEPLIASYVLCGDQKKLPPLAIELAGLLEKQLGGKADGPVILVDLAVRKKGTELLYRSHSEHPYQVLHDELLGWIQARHLFEPSVHCLAICRKDNLALRAHVRVGWQVLPDVSYTDAEGLEHHVLYLPVAPAADLIS